MPPPLTINTLVTLLSNSVVLGSSLRPEMIISIQISFLTLKVGFGDQYPEYFLLDENTSRLGSGGQPLCPLFKTLLLFANNLE